jgi:hypothetical protein
VAEGGEVGPNAGRADLGATTGSMSRLKRRIKALERRQRQLEPNEPLKLLTTAELRRALALIQRGGVLPSGDVRRPEVFRSASAEEREALEHWTQLCGEPLDHLEAAEELLDRMGEAHGWRSLEAINAALFLQRLELPDASPWLVAKRAEAVLNFYAELDEHGDEPRHPKVRGAVRRLERLEEIDWLAPERESASEGDGSPEELEASQTGQSDLQSVAEASPSGRPRRPPAGGTEPLAAPERAPWWRRVFGG